MENSFTLDGLLFDTKRSYIEFMKLSGLHIADFNESGIPAQYQISEKFRNERPECFQYIRNINKREWFAKNRYFLVFFIAQKDKEFDIIEDENIYDTLEGHIALMTESGKYLNRDMTILLIKKSGLKNVVIRSITELCKEDYQDWVSKKEE